MGGFEGVRTLRVLTLYAEVQRALSGLEATQKEIDRLISKLEINELAHYKMLCRDYDTYLESNGGLTSIKLTERKEPSKLRIAFNEWHKKNKKGRG